MGPGWFPSHDRKGDELYNLANLRQTQGSEGDGEFMFEEITLNELI